MRRAEQIISLIWVGLAASVCLASIRLEIGTFSDPGSGFLPFGTGAILGILGIVHGANVTLRPQGKEEESSWADARWQRGISVIVALLAYTLLLPVIGYLLDTFLLMSFLFGVLGRKRWWATVLGSLVVIGSTYLLFSVWLGVQFPKGFLGIG